MLKKFILLLAVLSVLASCSSPSVEKNRANTWVMEDLDGTKVRLGDYEGKKVYVKFWASWCPICLSGLAEVNALAVQENDFEVLTVVAPSHANEMPTKDFIKWFKGVQNTENIPVLLNEGGSVAKAFQVKGYPTSVFLNKKGEVVRSQPGHLSNDQIIAAMNEID